MMTLISTPSVYALSALSWCLLVKSFIYYLNYIYIDLYIDVSLVAFFSQDCRQSRRLVGMSH